MKVIDKHCPMDTPRCRDDCQWYMNGECAMKVIAKNLSEAKSVKPIKK